MSPVLTMLIMIVAGLVITMTTGEGMFFVCFALLAPLMAVSAKQSQERKEQIKLLRMIAEQGKAKNDG